MIFNDSIEVTIQKSKTSSEAYKFVITEPRFIQTLVKYRDMIDPPLRNGKFLKTYSKKLGKIKNTNCGINTVRDVTVKLASLLKLSTPEKYTSHSMRRSGKIFKLN
jgi:hypothetical protein